MDIMVKVDPKLFVTCRLCLEDLGHYQIVPQVQHQIKYCFDIDVGLFDGLPQLVCQKCKTILQDYYEIKQNFVAKQATLKDKYTNNENQTDDVREGSPCSSTKAEDENINPFGSKRKRCRLPSSSSSDNLDVQNPEEVEPVKKRCKSSKASSWKSFYKRKFMCQLCSKVCKRKNSLSKHLKKHNSLIACYPNVFKWDCKIRMEKVDDNLNMTGSNNTVVYSANRIISNEGSYNHCVIYTPKKSCSESRLNSSDSCEKNQNLVNDDSSDDDIKGSRVRSRTRSSNETVILNDGNEQDSGAVSDEEESDRDCIKIDDSSDTESTHRVLRDSADTSTVHAHISDRKAIESIINICHKRYLKKIEGTESEGPAVDEEKLKRIILNMGQKVVTKQGFNCGGLLRFMLNADLNIKWIQANCRSPKDSNYVYIQPKLVNKSSINKPEPGWVDLPGQHVIPINHVFESEENVNGKISSNIVVPVSQTDNSQGKLLNESPVANPKQLPKKTYANQSSENTDPEPNIEPEVNGEMCMPIIMSTTSLAVPPAEARDTPSATENAVVPPVTMNESEKSLPRIKVKPVSELMSERVLKNLNQTQTNTTNIWDTPQPTNKLPVTDYDTHLPVTVTHVPLLMPNGTNTNTLPVEALRVIPCGPGAAVVAPAPAAVVAPAAAATGGAGGAAQAPRPARAANTDFVVLDTIELPNTRTDSPFKYIKNLLQMYNLVLLETHESLTRDFVCLIKFKLQFKQDSVEQPVVLFLSVQCNGNKFYLGVKHSDQENNIDLSALPANWQWEIINKVYREEVANKVLKNALKMCQSTHDYTKKFICLLKSIKKREV